MVYTIAQMPIHKRCTACIPTKSIWALKDGTFCPKFNTLYRKTTLIAKTSFSKVYKCVPTQVNDEHSGEWVVKIQNPLMNDNNVMNELRILRHLQDVSEVVSLVYAEVRLCACYFVFEHIRGLPLNKYMKTYPNTNKIDIVNYLLQAFKNIQRKHIVHRDIKFDNIMVEMVESTSCPFRIRIIDFGLSVYQSNLKHFTHNQTVGTYQFQCPEMYMGCSYNGSCDTWSFGVLIYMLFFDKAPYIVKKKELQYCHMFRIIPEQMEEINIKMNRIKINKLRGWLQQMLMLNKQTRPLLLDITKY